jgi:hypothetical protein
MMIMLRLLIYSQLGNFASRQERDDITYGVRLYDCYPKTIVLYHYHSCSQMIYKHLL